MRIIGSDYDGTLTYGGIDDRKRKAIAAWQAAGNCFALVSGRGVADLHRIRQEQRLALDYYLGCNGGVILDREGKLLWCEEFKESAARFLENMLALGCPLAYVNTAQTQYIIRLQGPQERENELQLHELPQIDRFFQISVRMQTPEASADVTARICRLYADYMTPLQNGCIIDIVPKGVNKASGLRRLAAILGCREADIVAVGDNINDLDMLTAFRSYAMESGVEAAKQAANFQTPGIAELIDRELSVKVR